LNRLLIAVLLVVCGLASVGAWRLAAGRAEEERTDVFGREAARATNAIDGRIHAYLEVLHGARGLFESTDGVTRDGWTAFVDALDIDERHPGTASVGFIRRVPEAELPAFEQDLLAFQPQGVFPRTTRAEHDVIDYVEPAVAQGAVGFDAATDPAEADALERAQTHDVAAATARLRLPTDDEDEPAIVFALPVHAHDGSVSGFVFAALHVREMLRGVVGETADGALSIAIYDLGYDAGREPTPADLVYADENVPKRIAQLSTSRRLEVGGRTWVLDFGATAEPDYDARRPWAILVVGMLVSALITGLVASVSTSRDRAYALAETMTQDLRQSEAQLAVARDAALAASRAKGEFLASMSHEIRTPLNAVIGTTDLLERTDLGPEQRRYVEVCRKAGDHLLALLNNVLDLSKIESGYLSIEQTEYDLLEVVDRCSDMIGPRVKEKGLELVCRIAPDVPAIQLGDPHRLGQIFINLLGNAIKFTSKGSITLEVLRTTPEEAAALIARAAPPSEGAAPPPAGPFLVFSVTDTGIGIPADKLLDVFSKFTQVDASTTRKYGGTGLGLTITKSLVELMGGRVGVDSTIGKGTRFWFVLPMTVVEVPVPIARSSTSTLEGLVVWAIDDNSTNRLILKDTLEGAGCTARLFELASDLVDALVEASHASALPNVLVCDGKLHDTDGYALVARIRDLGIGDVPVLLLTSDIAGGDRARAKELGINGQLEKPVRPRDLVKAINRVLDPDATGGMVLPRQTRMAAAANGRRWRVLVAEDNEDNRLIVEAYLKGEPVAVTFAEDGVIAVEKALSAPWDLILMDMQMPRMDGLEATREIRRQEAGRGLERTPLVALTAHAFAEERQKMADAGCDDFATKPIRRDVLLKLITDRARPPSEADPEAATRTRSAPPAEERSSTSSTRRTLAPAAAMPVAPPSMLVPPTAVRRVVVRPAKPLAPLVPGYLAKRNEDVAALRASAASADFARIAVLGHGMKGSGGSFGFTGITEVGARIEQAAREQDAAAVLRCADELADYLGRVEVVVDA
jgi:two-component system sensor histidine kinase/response regulator